MISNISDLEEENESDESPESLKKQYSKKITNEVDQIWSAMYEVWVKKSSFRLEETLENFTKVISFQKFLHFSII